MDKTAKLPESPEPSAAELLEQVKQCGLQTYFWDGVLHFLPARLASANHELIVKLHQHRESVRRELENSRKADEAPGRRFCRDD